MIGLGLIGIGDWGAVHAQAMRDVAGVRLAACCHADRGKAAAFAARFGGRAHLDHQALLADPEVDAVIIATPHHLHAEHAIAMAAAGKPMLLEKPMAPSVAECDRIREAIAAAATPLVMGHTMRFAQPCLAAKRLIEAGALGPAQYGVSRLTKLWMEPNRRPWHLTRATGGGLLLTAGLHALDRLIFLIGRRVAGVSAIIETAHHRQEVDDAALLLLRFEGGGAGAVTSLGYRDGAMLYDAEITGPEGVLQLEHGRGAQIGRGGRWEEVAGSAETDWHIKAIGREIAALRAVVETGAAAPVTGSDGRHVIAVIEAAHRAAEERREIAVA